MEGGPAIESSDLENQDADSHDFSALGFSTASSRRVGRKPPTLVLPSQTLSKLCRQELPIFMETPKEGQVGLGLRTPELSQEAGVGLAGTPEAMPALCPHMNRVLLGPFQRCYNSGEKNLGSAWPPGPGGPAPIPALALKSCGALGRLPALSGLELLSVLWIGSSLSSQALGLVLESSEWPPLIQSPPER